MATSEYIASGSKVRDAICLPVWNRSTIEMTDTSEVPLIRSMKLLPRFGRAIRTACGMTTWRRVCMRVKFRVAAASNWPRGIAATAERNVSATYAPVCRLIVMIAALHTSRAIPTFGRP